MAKAAVSARLRYLNESSHLLAASSPRTSALLRSQCDELALDNEVSLGNSQGREACSACGTIFVPGWSQEVQAKTRRPRRTKRRLKVDAIPILIPAGKEPLTAPETAIFYQCKLCQRETRMPLSKRKPEVSSRRRAQQLPVRTAGHESHVAGTKVTASRESAQPMEITRSSTKKRARSKKLGLQAMLANRRQGDTKLGSTSGFGLDLMDLMKQAKD